MWFIFVFRGLFILNLIRAAVCIYTRYWFCNSFDTGVVRNRKDFVTRLATDSIFYWTEVPNLDIWLLSGVRLLSC